MSRNDLFLAGAQRIAEMFNAGDGAEVAIDEEIEDLRINLRESISVVQTYRTRARVEGEFLGGYVHLPSGNRQGALVKVATVQTYDDAKVIAKAAQDVAMNVVASRPKYVSRDTVPVEVIEAEKEVIRGQIASEGKPKPPQVIEKMVEGKLGKFFSQVCLMDQPWVRDPKITVAQYLAPDAVTVVEFKLVTI